MSLIQVFLCASLSLPASAIITLPPKTDQALIGSVYLPPANGLFTAFSDASRQANDSITQSIRTRQSEYGPVDNQETSFSISVFSAASNETLFDFHFEAPKLNGSYTKGSLTGDTIYRTGSLGKLLTIYALLVDVGDHVYLDPITKYVVSFGTTVRGSITRHLLTLSSSSQNSAVQLKLCLRTQSNIQTGMKSPLAALSLKYPALGAIVSLATF
jgi:Beta-lactamase